MSSDVLATKGYGIAHRTWFLLAGETPIFVYWTIFLEMNSYPHDEVEAGPSTSFPPQQVRDDSFLGYSCVEALFDSVAGSSLLNDIEEPITKSRESSPLTEIFQDTFRNLEYAVA